MMQARTQGILRLVTPFFCGLFNKFKKQLEPQVKINGIQEKWRKLQEHSRVSELIGTAVEKSMELFFNFIYLLFQLFTKQLVEN